MQVQRYAAYPERALYYLCRLYGTQLERGESYGQLTPVIGMHFLDYEHFQTYPDTRFCFELRDVQYPELRLTQDLSLHVFELPKLKRQGQRAAWGDPVFEWLHFLNYAHEEDEIMRTHYTNPAIHKAFDLLETLSADELTRQQAEMREKALKNEVSMLEAARTEGFLQNAREAVVETLQVRFNRVPQHLIGAMSAITNLAFLKHLHRQAITVDSLEEFMSLFVQQPPTL
jgi:predicted transposase/invertase (TIGR01784 family)